MKQKLLWRISVATHPEAEDAVAELLGALLGLGVGCAHAAQVPPPGSSGSLIWNSSGNWAGGTLSGDCSNSSLTLTCTKVNGVTVSLGGALSFATRSAGEVAAVAPTSASACAAAVD